MRTTHFKAAGNTGEREITGDITRKTIEIGGRGTIFDLDGVIFCGLGYDLKNRFLLEKKMIDSFHLSHRSNVDIAKQE